MSKDSRDVDARVGGDGLAGQAVAGREGCVGGAAVVGGAGEGEVAVGGVGRFVQPWLGVVREGQSRYMGSDVGAGAGAGAGFVGGMLGGAAAALEPAVLLTEGEGRGKMGRGTGRGGRGEGGEGGACGEGGEAGAEWMHAAAGVTGRGCAHGRRRGRRGGDGGQRGAQSESVSQRGAWMDAWMRGCVEAWKRRRWWWWGWGGAGARGGRRQYSFVAGCAAGRVRGGGRRVGWPRMHARRRHARMRRAASAGVRPSSAAAHTGSPRDAGLVAR